VTVWREWVDEGCKFVGHAEMLVLGHATIAPSVSRSAETCSLKPRERAVTCPSPVQGVARGQDDPGSSQSNRTTSEEVAYVPTSYAESVARETPVT